MNEECAKKLRVGESRRDASDKIRGFLYQDLIAIDTMISLNDTYSCYIEWVEDIFFENDDEIILIQVKYYPSSTVNFSEIFSDMYYQFLKFQLINSEKKIKTFCYHHSSTNMNENQCKNSVKSKIRENDTIDKNKIFEELKMCTEQTKRKELLFERVSSTKYLNSLDFKADKKASISVLKEAVSQELIALFSDNSVIKKLLEDEAKKILISLAIDFIQRKYYSKSEKYEERRISKKDLKLYINTALSYDELKGITLIKSVVFNCIDSIFIRILENKDFYGDDVVEKYKKIYIASKEYFNKNLNEKQSRFALLNTVSLYDEKKLNYEQYKDYIVEYEKNEFFRNEERIEAYIESLWKLIYNIESEDNNIKLENYVQCRECLLFQSDLEPDSPVLLSSFVQPRKPYDQANNIFSRIRKMKIKPKKWYLSGPIKGKYLYSYGITKIDSADNDITKISYNDTEYFKVECLNCLKCEIQEMHVNDKLDTNLFLSKCKDEV